MDFKFNKIKDGQVSLVEYLGSDGVVVVPDTW